MHITRGSYEEDLSHGTKDQWLGAMLVSQFHVAGSPTLQFLHRSTDVLGSEVSNGAGP